MLGMMGISRIDWIGRVHHIMLRRIRLVHRLNTRMRRVKRLWGLNQMLLGVMLSMAYDRDKGLVLENWPIYYHAEVDYMCGP